MMQHYFVLTAEQRTAAMALNHSPANINPIAITSATPGSGLNLNELADWFAVGAAVPLTGMFVAPYRIVNNPDFQTHAPAMVTLLLTLPSAQLEDETIFLPPSDD